MTTRPFFWFPSTFRTEKRWILSPAEVGNEVTIGDADEDSFIFQRLSFQSRTSCIYDPGDFVFYLAWEFQGYLQR